MHTPRAPGAQPCPCACQTAWRMHLRMPSRLRSARPRWSRTHGTEYWMFMFSQPPPLSSSRISMSSSSHCSKCSTGVSSPRLLPLFFPVTESTELGRSLPSRVASAMASRMAFPMRIWFMPTGVWITKVGMPVSWQTGPVSSTAISMFERIMSNACEDCVAGVSMFAASDIAARTSGGRLVEVCVISSKRLAAKNSITVSGISILRGGACFSLPSNPFCMGRLIQLEAHVGHHAGADGGDGAVEFHQHLGALDLFDIARDAGGLQVGDQHQRRLSGPEALQNRRLGLEGYFEGVGIGGDLEQVVAELLRRLADFPVASHHQAIHGRVHVGGLESGLRILRPPVLAGQNLLRRSHFLERALDAFGGGARGLIHHRELGPRAVVFALRLVIDEARRSALAEGQLLARMGGFRALHGEAGALRFGVRARLFQARAGHGGFGPVDPLLGVIHGAGGRLAGAIQPLTADARQYLPLVDVLPHIHQEGVDNAVDLGAHADYVLRANRARECNLVGRQHGGAGRANRKSRRLAPVPQREHPAGDASEHRRHREQRPFAPHTQC